MDDLLKVLCLLIVEQSFNSDYLVDIAMSGTSVGLILGLGQSMFILKFPCAYGSDLLYTPCCTNLSGNNDPRSSRSHFAN